MCSNNVTSLIPDNPNTIEERVVFLLSQMTVAEKIGQMSQFNCDAHNLHQAISEGRVGSVLNEVNTENINHMQWLATENSPHGIPLLIGRDVIHGFKTIFPIPLGQAASWNPEIVMKGARIGAIEAASIGVNWTFAPMIDITRDPRWGRIAESLGEDSYLGSIMATAMIKGFQGDDLSNKGSIAACAKHFAGYGACEAGIDYGTVSIPEVELRNVYLRPFNAAADAQVATFMTSFSDLNGVPATGSEFLLKQVLRQEWEYQGMVVSDWNSIGELSTHGLTANDKEAAYEAANAGVDMEMASTCYANHLPDLIKENRIPEEKLDSMVANILRTKFDLGLFDNPYTHPEGFPKLVNEQHLQLAKRAALEEYRKRMVSVGQVESEQIRRLGAEAEAREAQLKMLRYQLNPHFLFNTLNNISALVKFQESEKAHRMIVQLGDFLRYSLDNNPTMMITLKQEVDALMLYLDIEKTRLGDRLNLVFDVSEQAKSARIPALLLQPLVENSIKYAISKNEEGGTIELKAHVEQGELKIELIDGGPDNAGHKEKKRKRGRRVGLHNTLERLKTLYKDAYLFDISLRNAGGLRVLINIPFDGAETVVTDVSDKLTGLNA